MSKKTSCTISLDQLSKHVTPEIARLNPGLFANQTPQQGKPAGTKTVVQGIVINDITRNDSMPRVASMNKTERRYYETFLTPEKLNKGDFVAIQAPRFFNLEGGGTYTPDFMVIHPADSGLKVEVIEIKGGYVGHGWEQGHERYKRVAAQYDGVTFAFMMCTWDNKKKVWKREKWSK